MNAINRLWYLTSQLIILIKIAKKYILFQKILVKSS